LFLRLHLRRQFLLQKQLLHATLVVVLLVDAEVDLVVVAIPADADPVLLVSALSSSKQH
jgi:hypothetical protein